MSVRVNRGRRSGGERVRLRIGSVAKAVLVTGQAYQDPKDALNEFVSNAADEYIEAGRADGRVRVVLRRPGDDAGPDARDRPEPVRLGQVR